jgi:glycosyltransferase involved in cell wall biosynthesis
MTAGERSERTATRPRVCWLTPDKPANISVGRQRLAAHLDERGFDIVLRGTTPRTVIEALADREGFDAVIGTTRAGAIAGAFLSVVKGCPLIVDHVDPISQFEASASRPVATVVRWLENACFALAASVLYVYPEERARVSRFAKRAKETDLGVEFDRFADPSSGAIRAARSRLAELELAPEERVGIYLGGLEPIYHIEELLESARHLENWTLLVVGDGSLSAVVERAASESERIEFLGSVPHEEVPGYLQVADVGVCLVDDPHTLKVLEYGAAGLPVVQLAGRAEKRFGELVEFSTTDPADIARAIERAGERSDDAERAETSLRAFASRFDWSQVAADYEQALEDVL